MCASEHASTVAWHIGHSSASGAGSLQGLILAFLLASSFLLLLRRRRIDIEALVEILVAKGTGCTQVTLHGRVQEAGVAK